MFLWKLSLESFVYKYLSCERFWCLRIFDFKKKNVMSYILNSLLFWLNGPLFGFMKKDKVYTLNKAVNQ